MENDRTLAMQCIAQIDALRAGVRYYDAATAAVLYPPEKRRPDFDGWLTEREHCLKLFVEGRTEAPPDLTEFAAQVSWLLTSYRKDAEVIRFLIWVMRRVLGVSLPLQPKPEAECDVADPAEEANIGWIFLLAAAALWLIMH